MVLPIVVQNCAIRSKVSYNCQLPLLSKTLTTAGKSVLVVAGAGYGLLRSLRLLGNDPWDSPGPAPLQARVELIDAAVTRLTERSVQLQSRLDEMVTREELSQMLERIFAPLEQRIEARFEHQVRSVEALRTMVRQTDELLQRVLDLLESVETESNPENVEQRLEWDLTRASS
jgi:Na+/phosphate symporter